MLKIIKQYINIISSKKSRDITSMDDKSNASPAALMKSVTKMSGGSSSIIVPMPAPTSNKKRKPDEEHQRRQEEGIKYTLVSLLTIFS